MADDTHDSVRDQARPADPQARAHADPAPVGLAGFALTTLLLSIVNTGLLTETGALIPVLGLAAFYGGLAEFVAGLFEFRRGNTFGATVFMSYGAFWLSYWWIVPHLLGTGADAHNALGLYLLGWAVFTAYLAVAALRTSIAVLGVLVLLTPTFVLLAVGEFQGGAPPPPAAPPAPGGGRRVPARPRSPRPRASRGVPHPVVSSGRSAADSSGLRSGRSRSQEGWRSRPARVRTL
ncbi:acetate uptake transporter [Streptomyces mexicanus]|uniref:acetate uptake transporter n=1 Tax=Streptomyces mexicanus TaxID=178566 RepID=UPI001F1FA15C|nr:acetate uptake transporter [Streptomyces mexicanus]